MDYVLQIVNTSVYVTDARAREIANAINEQFVQDFDPAWGMEWRATFATASDGSLQPQRPILYLVDAMPDPSYARYLGVHTVNANGMPEAYVNASHPALLNGPFTVPIFCSHEAMELAANPWCNRLVDGFDGNVYEMEVCDPVEGQSYAHGGVLVSDFVLPAWYIAGSAGPWDLMRQCDGPLRVVRGGRLYRQPYQNTMALVGAAELEG